MGNLSFAAFYAEHAARVRRALILSGADRETAADVAQEAFARTYARWRQVRSGTNPAGYVYRTAFRELRRRGHLPDRPDGDAAAGSTATDGHGPEERALASVAAAAAQLAIRAMPPRRRACALLVLAAGLTAEEAGQALGVTPSTVRVQVHRARACLLALPQLAGGEIARPAADRAEVAPAVPIGDALPATLPLRPAAPARPEVDVARTL